MVNLSITKQEKGTGLAGQINSYHTMIYGSRIPTLPLNYILAVPYGSIAMHLHFKWAIVLNVNLTIV